MKQTKSPAEIHSKLTSITVPITPTSSSLLTITSISTTTTRTPKTTIQF